MLRLMRLTRADAATVVHGTDELLPLVEASLAGDDRATRTLLIVLGPRLLRVARRVFGQRHPDVEDVAQECAFELMRALPQFRRESKVMHFASRVALQVAMNARRRLHATKRDAPLANDPQFEWSDPSGTSPEESLVARRGLSLLRALCDELPPTQSEALGLHYILGYTVPEVAEICGIPLETVRTRLRVGKLTLLERARAHSDLRTYLEGSDD
jgi:RNA polymerase sigma-70 factor (ECF subfamily)